ncbi:hypothetical protein NW765_005732 [Fusarium oxysporum]|nr:hypothetical protein NW765_005732 [Fusarium oxysporum]
MADNEPTPAETAAANAKEAEEQAALPYKWTQTISELDVTFNVPETSSRGISSSLSRSRAYRRVSRARIQSSRYTHNSNHISYTN